MAQRLAKLVTAALGWMGRQTLTVLVIVVGAMAGWFGRKSIGPVVVSESVAARPVSARVPRPVGADGAGEVKQWLGKARSLASPGDSLQELHRMLEAGEVTDFGRLARGLLTHPLELFRHDAMKAVLDEWGRKDPAAALTFLAEFRSDLDTGIYELPEGGWAIARAWAAAEPEAALRFLTPGKLEQLELREAAVVEWATRPGGEDGPGMMKRLQLVASRCGEAALSRHLASVDFEPWLKAGRVPSPEDWRSLAQGAKHPQLKALYESMAFVQWRDGPAGAEAESGIPFTRGWGVSPSVGAGMDRFGPAEGVAAFLRSAAAADLPDRGLGMFAALLPDHAELARSLYREGVGVEVMDPSLVAHLLRSRGEGELRAWLEVVPGSGERRQLVSEWLLPVRYARTADELASGVANALTFGADGESLVAGALGRPVGKVAQQVPEIFASLPADVQARNRMDVVIGLAKSSPDAAAEIWMDATPGELSQPGAAVVAEKLAERLIQRDTEVASGWLRQLPPGESRDRAVAVMVERLAADDPATCAAWAETIVDAGARARAAAALDRATSPPQSP